MNENNNLKKCKICKEKELIGKEKIMCTSCKDKISYQAKEGLTRVGTIVGGFILLAGAITTLKNNDKN